MGHDAQSPGGKGEFSRPTGAGLHAEQLTAKQAAERLGVKLATLYAYVSRGQLRSSEGPPGRGRRYLRADVERLRARAQARRGGPPAGGELLTGSEPVLDSAISWLTEEGPLYRGHAAVELARSDVSFERVAELLWSGQLPNEPVTWPAPRPRVTWERLQALVPPGTPAIAGLLGCTTALGVRDLDRFELGADAIRTRARTLIRTLAACVALSFDPAAARDALTEPSVASAMARALGLRRSRAVLQTLDRIMILLADHELNASAFAARVAASTRADIYACISAGLATLSGPRHGGASEQVAAMIESIEHPERTVEFVRERLRLGERIPGFGHAVYRGRDPRVDPLLESARSLAADSPAVQITEALIQTLQDSGRPAPNVDLALAAVAGALRLPGRAIPALFAVARIAGFTAHIIEQYASPGLLLRPRARYREVP